MKNQKGITLTVLVITIVIMLILAGIVLTLTIGQDGIIKKAKEAKENMIAASNSEKEELEKIYNEIDNWDQLTYDEKSDAKDEINGIKLKISGSFWTGSNVGTRGILTLYDCPYNKVRIEDYSATKSISISGTNYSLQTGLVIDISEYKGQDVLFVIDGNIGSISTATLYFYM